MQSPTIGAALEREHRDIDAGLGRFASGLERGEWRSDDLSAAARALRRHIYLEEALLFPPLRQGGLVAPVLVMVREHGEIWRTLDELEALDADGTDSSAASDAYAILNGLLERHNSKEEVILYPAADRTIDAAADAELRAFLDTGVLPEGWVCEGLRQ